MNLSLRFSDEVSDSFSSAAASYGKRCREYRFSSRGQGFKSLWTKNPPDNKTTTTS